jgi:transcriptional regulator with XRE-family HTH domain
VKLDSAKVRWHRDRLGWTLDTLAEQAEVAEGTALRAEHGEDIRPSSGRRIARALGVDVSELVPEKPGATRPKVAAPPSPPPIAEEERRKPLSVEWALTAPDTEFDSRLKTATLPEVMALLPLNLHAEDVSGDDRIRILERVSKIVSRFQILGGPFDLAKDWEDRSASEDRRDQETA